MNCKFSDKCCFIHNNDLCVAKIAQFSIRKRDTPKFVFITETLENLNLQQIVDIIMKNNMMYRAIVNK